MTILAGKSHDDVLRLLGEAEAHARSGEESEALQEFLEAWELLPEPKDAWGAAQRILTGVSDLLAARGDLSDAIELLLAHRQGLSVDRLRTGR